MPEAPLVVILGGGFGGLAAARALRRAPVRVLLLDRRNHHLFQPLLYQVATAGLSPAEIASPIRRILRRQENATVLLAEATAIDPERKRVLLSDGEVAYDYLVMATGATHSYFGREEWARFAPGLKTLDDALEIRRRALLAFEAAEREPNAEKRRQWLTFVVIGGGPATPWPATSGASIPAPPGSSWWKRARGSSPRTRLRSRTRRPGSSRIWACRSGPERR